VFGISCDNQASHETFSGKFDLNFPLLCDEDHSACEAYGVWVEKSRLGIKSMGIQRASFLIGKDGKVARTWPAVNVDGHVDDVAEAVARL